MKMILFNQNPMITKLLESVSKKLELPMENFNHYQELSARLKKDPEWILIADDECLEKLDQVDWLELKETISQNKNSVCMYKKGNEMQPFLEGFEVKIKKPFLPTEMLKVLQKKLGSDMSELEPSQNLDPTQEVLETNWDELENLGDLEALAKEEPNNEEQLLPTLDAQEEKEEVKKEEKEEIKETPQEEEKPKDDETQESETPKDEEVSKELETQEKLEIPKEEMQEEQVKEQEPIKEETQENKEEKQEETQDSPSAQELEAMQELVKEIQENSNEDKKETQESTEIPQDKEIQEVVTEKTQVQELEIPKEKTQESAEALQETQAQELEKQEIAETPQEKEKQEDTETPQELEIPQAQEKETPQEETQEKETPQTQDETPQEDHYESIEDIPEPVMAKAMGEELPFLNEAVAKTPNNENATETPKESVTETPKESVTETPKESDIKTPQEKEESDKTSSPLELRLNLQDLLKNLNQESLKSLLENKTLSIKITLEDKKPNA
ncbi:chemotaxis regulatory protein ChePep [Helicobacter pylori]|uniref:chemotaxis regulatory protein ChePep n=1 Tax=Helicobacter pylori TaxID=210 RepID=UPI000C311C04|nr:chemotaxis regulatory protein ChePep [Helicobacter pylori]